MQAALGLLLIFFFILLILCLLPLASYLVQRKLSRKRAKKLTPEEKKALRAKRHEEFHKIAKQHGALRNAMNKGLKISDLTMEQIIEIYREDRKEETIKAAMEEFGMTREEAIEKGFIHGLTQVAVEARCRKESERLGREISARDLYGLDRESLMNSPYPGPDCLEPWEIQDYLKNKKWSRDNAASHLESCIACHAMAEATKPIEYPPPGPNCYTEAELDQVAETGYLPESRLSHKDTCEQCKNKLSSSQQDFIEKMVPYQPFHMADLDMDFGG